MDFCQFLIIFCVTAFCVLGREFIRYKATETCIGQGLQCTDDCTGIIYCDGKDRRPVRSRYCFYSDNKKCFSNYTSAAWCADKKSDCELGNRGAFKCHEEGMVPDPFDCRRSYQCSKENSDYTSHCVCGLGSVWVGPTECSTDEKAIQACCRDFEVDCKSKQGDNFGEHCPLTALGYYYTCKNTTTTTVGTHRCPKNQIFNKSTFKCEVGLFLFSNSTTAAVSSTSTNITVTKRSVKLAPPDVPYCFKKSK